MRWEEWSSAWFPFVAVAVLCKCGPSQPTAPAPVHAASPASSASAGSPPPSPTVVAPPAVTMVTDVYNALVGVELVQANPASSRTVFVFLREPASLDATAATKTFTVARSAFFEVADDHKGSREPHAMTSLPPIGPACVGHTSGSVLLKVKRDAGPDRVERGVVLEGCEPAGDVYATLVLPGAHPAAQRLDPTELELSAAPAWVARLSPQRVYQFDGAPPLIVAAVAGERDEWVVGSRTRSIGAAAVDTSQAPVLLRVGDQTLLIANDAVLNVGGLGVQRISDFTR